MTDVHPNVALVRGLFERADASADPIAMDGYLEGGWDTLFADDVSYCGTSSHGNLQLALGKQAVFELSREAAQFMEPDERGEELLDCVAFGDELVAVHTRCHRLIRNTGERVSYEYVMVVRIEDGVITRGVDVGERKIDDVYLRARGRITTPNVPATAVLSAVPRQPNGHFKETSE
jgi:ketosteroid isomerase-like protein